MDTAGHLRGWYFDPFRGMGVAAEVTPLGTFWSHGRAYVRGLPARRAGALVKETRRRFPGLAWRLCLDGKEARAALAGELTRAGLVEDDVQLFFEHGGPLPSPPPSEASLEPVHEGNLAEATRVKLQAFANTEGPADAEAFASEVAARRLEIRGFVRGRLLRVGGAPAAVLFRRDQGDGTLVFNLGTRPSFQGRGHGSALLCETLRTARERGGPCVINVSENNPRARTLYQRLGFTRLVGWRSEWREAT